MTDSCPIKLSLSFEYTQHGCCKWLKPLFKHKMFYSPIQWHFIWQKFLFQASLSHHEFGCHPCLLGFNFPKCSLLKSNIHSKVYYTKFNLTETRSQNGHFPITLVLMIRTRPYNSTWLDYSLFLWTWQNCRILPRFLYL